MKTLISAQTTLLAALAVASGGFPAAALPSEPHRIVAIAVTPEGWVRLTLDGKNGIAFKSYFDLFRVERSGDLQRWDSLAMLVRTNAATNAVTYLDKAATSSPLGFYRAVPESILTAFLPPSGPHSVGTFSRMLTDVTRTNRFGVGTNSAFMATIWYPAQSQPLRPAGLAPYQEGPLAQRGAYWGSYTNRIPSLVSHALTNAPLTMDLGRLPVVVYSHGLGDREGRAVRTENTRKAVELASHGYLVVAVDHTDAYAVVLPHGELMQGRNVWSFNFAADRLKDVAFLLDRLGEWNAADPFLLGRLDLERVGIMGWSFGGGTAAEACRVENRLKAAVLLDPYLAAVSVVQEGLLKPFLNMAGTPDPTLFSKASTNAYQLTINGASHETYTDNAWIIGPNAASRRRALAMDACMVSFFNKHLKGVDDGLLENPAAVHPDVMGFRKK